VIPDHVPYLQILYVDGAVGVRHGAAGLVQEIASTIFNLLVQPGDSLAGSHAILASFFFAGEASLEPGQPPLRTPVKAGILYPRSVAEHREALQPQVYSHVPMGLLPGLGFDLAADECIPLTGGHALHDEGLDVSSDGSVQTHSYASDLGEHELVSLHFEAGLRVGYAPVPAPTLVTGSARFEAGLSSYVVAVVCVSYAFGDVLQHL